MNVNGKYIKDENGNIISPITSSKTTFMQSGNSVEDGLAEYKILYKGSFNVPSRTSGNTITINLSDNVNNYTVLVINVIKCGVVVFNDGRNFLTNSIKTPMCCQYSMWSTERFNAFGFKMEGSSDGMSIVFSGGHITQIQKGDSDVSPYIKTMDNYQDVNIVDIIGINYKF